MFVGRWHPLHEDCVCDVKISTYGVSNPTFSSILLSPKPFFVQKNAAVLVTIETDHSNMPTFLLKKFALCCQEHPCLKVLTGKTQRSFADSSIHFSFPLSRTISTFCLIRAPTEAEDKDENFFICLNVSGLSYWKAPKYIEASFTFSISSSKQRGSGTSSKAFSCVMCQLAPFWSRIRTLFMTKELLEVISSGNV